MERIGFGTVPVTEQDGCDLPHNIEEPTIVDAEPPEDMEEPKSAGVFYEHVPAGETATFAALA